jgi:hypothetical protein
MNSPVESKTTWKRLYLVGGAAALLMAVLIPIQIIVFILLPAPSTVLGWFTLFEHSQLLGLLDMYLLLLVDQLLLSMVFLALYFALQQTNPSLMTIALVLGLLRVAAYVASAVAFEMLYLCNQYAAATTESQKSTLLAAGQVLLVGQLACSPPLAQAARDRVSGRRVQAPDPPTPWPLCRAHARRAFAAPDERRGLSIPATGCPLQPGDDLFRPRRRRSSRRLGIR